MQTGQNSIAPENSLPQLGQVRWGSVFMDLTRPSEAIKASQRAWILPSASSGATWQQHAFVGKAVCLDLISFHLAPAPPSANPVIAV